MEGREVLGYDYISLGSTNLLHHMGHHRSGALIVLQLSWAAGLLLLMVVVG